MTPLTSAGTVESGGNDSRAFLRREVAGPKARRPKRRDQGAIRPCDGPTDSRNGASVRLAGPPP